MSFGKKVAVAAILLLSALFGALIGVLVYYPNQVSGFVGGLLAQGGAAHVEDASEDVMDRALTDEDMRVQTRQIAAYGKVPIYSPIDTKDLTGVLFHQASYTTALVVTTELPTADPAAVSVDYPVRVNHEQDEGDWVDADALHLYRTQDTTPMDTAIDVGAKVGTTVYAPVTGTVVLVQDYSLYGEIPDTMIHIQPKGHPELDVVLLHQSDPTVKPGDAVVGGQTPISRIRDIAKDLTDVQLGFFTPPDDPGNHSHVQVNDANAPGYRQDTLKGAYKVKE